MRVVFSVRPDGSFVCGDLDSRVTWYAYPTSHTVAQFTKNGDSLALEMLTKEIAFRPWCHPAVDLVSYDTRHWNWLRDAGKVCPVAVVS